MKKIVLSSLVALTIGTVSATAGEMKFYQDEVGQVFTTPAEGRTEISSKSDTPIFAKSSKLKFSGKHYVGYTYTQEKKAGVTQPSRSNFDFRRNYLQVKAYLLEDPKSYFRVTLDALEQSNLNSDDTDGTYMDVYVKYAYLYLNDVLPNTGVELGLAHRPWIDYESKTTWSMRSIAKSFTDGLGVLTSSDFGVNFQTKTPYVTSEIGMFNGEGYHAEESGAGNSIDWRLTAAVFGNGDKKRKFTKNDFLDISFFGQVNSDSNKNNEVDYTVLGGTIAYNTPSFLASAQYVESDSDKGGKTKYNGEGYSLNTTFRMGDKKEYSAFARYDMWEKKNVDTDVVEEEETKAIYGVAWQQNKNLKWLLSGESVETKDKTGTSNTKDEEQVAMITAEIKW